MPQNNVQVRVCKKFFLNTLGLKDGIVRKVVKKRVITTKMAVKANNSKIPDARYEFFERWLEAVGKQPAHYVRKSSARTYLSSDFRTRTEVFKEYQKYSKDNNLTSFHR